MSLSVENFFENGAGLLRFDKTVVQLIRRDFEFVMQMLGFMAIANGILDVGFA